MHQLTSFIFKWEILNHNDALRGAWCLPVHRRSVHLLSDTSLRPAIEQLGSKDNSYYTCIKQQELKPLMVLYMMLLTCAIPFGIMMCEYTQKGNMNAS